MDVRRLSLPLCCLLLILAAVLLECSTSTIINLDEKTLVAEDSTVKVERWQNVQNNWFAGDLALVANMTVPLKFHVKIPYQSFPFYRYHYILHAAQSFDMPVIHLTAGNATSATGIPSLQDEKETLVVLSVDGEGPSLPQLEITAVPHPMLIGGNRLAFDAIVVEPLMFGVNASKVVFFSLLIVGTITTVFLGAETIVFPFVLIGYALFRTGLHLGGIEDLSSVGFSNKALTIFLWPIGDIGSLPMYFFVGLFLVSSLLLVIEYLKTKGDCMSVGLRSPMRILGTLSPAILLVLSLILVRPLYQLAAIRGMTSFMGLLLFCYGSKELLFKGKEDLFSANQFSRIFCLFGKSAVLPWIVIGGAFIFFALISTEVFHRVPVAEDSATSLVQALLFTKGKLYGILPQDPLPALTAQMVAQVGDRWWSVMPPGHAMFLALGAIWGSAWLVNPLLSTLSISLIYLATLKLFDRETALLTILLLATSPFVAIIGGEYINHASSTMGLALALYGVSIFSSCSGKKSFGAALAGIGLGIVIITRPLTAAGVLLGFIAGLPLGEAKQLWSNKKRALSFFLIPISCSLVTFALFNHYTSGSLWVSGYEVVYGKIHNPGFGPSPHGINHTIALGIQNLFEDLVSLNDILLGWPIPALMVLSLLFLRRAPLQLKERVIISTIVGGAIAYVFHWSHSSIFGPRFLYEVSWLLVLLIARAITSYGREGSEVRKISVMIFVTAFVLFNCSTQLVETIRTWSIIASR